MTDPHAPVFRFAPSPNGPLHLGHALSALTGFEMARRTGGRFLVRIEDIDVARSKPELTASILEDLAWLGIRWEEPVMHQSTRFEIYREAVHRMQVDGVLYPCFATRGELAAVARPGARDPDGAPLVMRALGTLPVDDSAARPARGETPALRLNGARVRELVCAKQAGRRLSFTEIDAAGHQRVIAARPERWGDAVIVRKDFPASYHLAVVVDDASQGVSHVTRGQDLYAATDLHRLLHVLLDLPEPLYHHHRLILGADGRKLSKSAGARSLASLRAAGTTPVDIRALIGLA